MFRDTVIKVVAQDKAGNVSDTLRIKLKRTDATPPVLVRSTGALDRSVDTSVKSTSVAWTATDNDKIQSVTINGVPVSLVGGKYSASISIKPGWNRVVVVAKDVASNETHDTIQIVSCVRPAIAAGGDFALYLKPDGNIVQYGISGAPEDQDIVQIAAAGKFAMALGADGMVRYFGSSPIVLPGLSKVRYIAGGGDNAAIAIKDDSTVVVWGDADEIASVKDVPAGLRAIAVAIGENFCAAIRASDSMLVVWGNVPSGLVEEKVKAISLRYTQLVAIKANGDAVVWGDFYSNNAPFIAPLATISGPISAVSAGFFHSIYLKNNGDVSGFGWNSQNRAQPGPQAKAIAAISVGYRYSLLLDVDGGWSAYGVINGYTFTLPAITP